MMFQEKIISLHETIPYPIPIKISNGSFVLEKSRGDVSLTPL